MKLATRTLAGAALFALALTGCNKSGADANGQVSNAPLKQIAAPQGSDWTQTVVETAEGGYRMGNPNAPVKLVEYASVTCPHCREFEEEGGPVLRDKYVKSGQVSWEFRPILLFASDPGATALLYCQGAMPFFRLKEELYADQQNWAVKLQGLSEAQQQQLNALPPQQRAAELVKVAGLDQFFQQRGMPAAKIQSCLADPANFKKIADTTERSTKEGVTGTPTFFINGQIQKDVAGWKPLEPSLRAAVG
ncbi:MAG TPA: thioredoxin domain-containing protein [Allosphingosinicella sp.]|jgi:protein-disulfide isomerase